ncbi:MAG: hypothetical protein U0793_08650 [Gemmataceae bacterium]
MLAAKVACPHCRAVLKSNKPVPDGTALNCPQCRRTFRVGVDVEAVKAGPPLGAAIAPPPAGFRPPPAPLAAPRPSDPSIALTPSSQKGRLFLVLGGLVFLAALGGVLLWLLTRRDGPDSATTAGELVLPGGAKSVAKPKARHLIALTPEEEKIVKEMTDKGVDWLKKTQHVDGTWAPYNGHMGSWPDGVTAMAGLTLLSCGVDAKDEAVRKAAARIRKTGPDLNRTYEIALCILFLDKLDDPGDEKLIETLVFNLMSGQNVQGGWHYTCNKFSHEEQEQVFHALRQLDKQSISFLQATPSADQDRKVQDVVKDLPPRVRGLAAFSKPPDKAGGFFRGGGDNSNTQFAVLGLWAAKKRGLPVDRPLQLAVRRFKESQNADGSWFYDNRNVIPEPTMTCAGLLAMAVEYGVRGKDDPKAGRPEDNPAIKKGLDVVARSLTPPRDVKAKKAKARAAYPPLYFVWSVERVGMLFQLEKIAGKDWYRWGMDILHDHQLPDGHWHQGWHATTDTVDTSFALLFLNRVNLAEDLTDKLTEFGLAAATPPVRKE